ncbi:hypothetical protein CPB85DRAFT_1427865 [Mucidula mucida]|nr:hypothetical protein CPB85DRAFT_1427865 [Mucidula mucida]
MAFPGYAPFTYGQSSHQPSPYFSYSNSNYNPYPYTSTATTPRYANNGGYLPQGTPYTNQVPFPGNPYGNSGTPYPAPTANLPNPSPPHLSVDPFIPPMPEDYASKKAHHRAASNPAGNGTPIKSAMKRSATMNPHPAQPQVRNSSERKRTPSSGTKQPLTRTRTKSDVKPSLFDLTADMESFESNFMFVYFQGNSEFVVEYATAHAQKEIRAHLLGIWTDGIEDEVKKDPLHLHLKFHGAPWNMTGPNKELWNMIITLFRIFALRGYGLSSVINLGFPPPRLVFCKQPRDNSTGFFLAFFSKNGYRVSLVHPPKLVDQSVVTSLHRAFPGFIDRNEMTSSGVRILELSKEAQKKPRKLLEGPSRGVLRSSFLTATKS